MTIWMADATIREARRAIAGLTGWNDVRRATYNLPEVEMAGKILFRMFTACEADIIMAILHMPKEMDGEHLPSGKNYFDEFVQNLDCEIRSFVTNNPDLPTEVKPREFCWIFEDL